MHILFLTDNFPPEGNAPATRTYEHAREWVRSGHKVTVITCAPNFPDGKVFAGYKNSIYSKSNLDGIDVVRVKTFISSNDGFLLRILDFMSFMVSSFIAGFFQKKVDVVIATSPQFFTAVSGFALSAICRKKFIFELRDIWPASITAVGAMKDSTVIKILEKIEMFLYRKADKIVSVTHSFKKELISRGVEGQKIDVILNGVDLSKYQPEPAKNQDLAKQFGLQDKFVIGYIGTHGLAHALENVLEAAEHLSNNDNIRIVFAGSGAERQRLIETAKKKQLTNIVFIPRQAKEKMPALWSLCDVSLISLRNSELFKTVIPSKIFESMGMGLPMVAAIPHGEASEIISKANAGIICHPENSALLAKEMKYLANNPVDLAKFRHNSAKAALDYDRKKMADMLLKLIEDTVT